MKFGFIYEISVVTVTVADRFCGGVIENNCRILRCNLIQIVYCRRYLTIKNVTDNCANGVQTEASKSAKMQEVWTDKRTTKSNAKLWTGAEEDGRTGPSANI